MRILKYFKVTVGLQKTNCLSGGLLIKKKTTNKNPTKIMCKYVVPYFKTTFKFLF